MKAFPLKRLDGPGTAWLHCAPAEAEYIRIFLPGPVGPLCLPVRQTPGAWQWNGSTEAPSLTPSLLTRGTCGKDVEFVCHCFVTDGRARFLSDSTHELSGLEVPLLEAE